MGNHTTYMYVGSVMILLLILLLGAQVMKPVPYNPRQYDIIVDTPKGLVSASNEKIANELQVVRDNIIKNKAGIGCPLLTPIIKQAMNNLVNFINANPRMNSEALCKLELRTDIIHQHMYDSITPDPLDWENEYKTVLEWEAHESKMNLDPKERLVYLVLNLDIAIALLRNHVCDYGRINITKLYDIIKLLEKQVCNVGAMYDNSNNQHEDSNNTSYGANGKTFKKLYAHSVMASESKTPKYRFDESRNNMQRKATSREAFASLSFDGYNSSNEPVQPEPSDGYDGLYDSVHKDKFVYMKSPSDIKGIANTDGEIKTQKLTQVEVVNRANTEYAKMRGSTLMDNTVEGAVEQDILGYTPPGHILSTFKNLDANRADRLSACLGKTPSDDQLWQTCTSHDMRMKLALDGDASAMIAGLEQYSYHH